MRTTADEIGSHLSCDRLPHEECAPDNNQSSGNPQQFLSPRPAMDRTDADPQSVQTTSGDHEAHAIQQRALAGWEFSPMCMSMEYGEESNQRRGNTQGRADF